MKNTNDCQTFVALYRFSAEIRWLHWLRALLIVALVVTGFYLAKPYLAPSPALEPVNFQNALVRFWHLIFGFGLTFVVIMRIFLYFFDQYSSRYERISFRDTLSATAWGQQLKYYMLRGPSVKQGAYGPLQNVTYTILTILLVIQVFTGFMLHAANYHDGLGGFLGKLLGPLTVWLGGLTGVSNLHYLIMWALIIFIPIHIYMVLWSANRNPGSGIEPMVSGYSFNRFGK